MSLIKTVNFDSLGDERGALVALEANRNVPFAIKRVYYISGTRPGIARGFHAHKKLRQLAVCVAGNCRFVLDNGVKREEIILDCPTMGLIIEDLTWREMYDFSPDCVLMVLADQYYDESDYIRDYQEFLNVANRVRD
jgi:dTDP-4-dehydrorhamnose 3,5-epimerase-like enzyme